MEVRFKLLKASVRALPAPGSGVALAGRPEQRDFTSYDSGSGDLPLLRLLHIDFDFASSRVSPHCCSFIVKYGPAQSSLPVPEEEGGAGEG